jgi:DNA transformation protein
LSERHSYDHIIEMFAGFGPVSVRRMFSGAGIFADGLMIGIVVDDVIYLKADDSTRPNFEREGLGPFTYRTKSGERALESYRRMPDRLYDDPAELSRWATGALECARRRTDETPRRHAGQSKRRMKRK